MVSKQSIIITKMKQFIIIEKLDYFDIIHDLRVPFSLFMIVFCSTKPFATHLLIHSNWNKTQYYNRT